MEDLDFAMFNSFVQSGQKEEGVYARFFDKWVKTGNIQENGIPEYVERVYIEIKVKNSTDTPVRPATEEDIRRFPREYAFYMNQKKKKVDGTPLNMFAFLNVPQLEVCQIKGITTIEELAALDDEKATAFSLTGAKSLALKFLDIAKDNQAIAKYEEEIKALKSEIETLKDENKALKEAAK